MLVLEDLLAGARALAACPVETRPLMAAELVDGMAGRATLSTVAARFPQVSGLTASDADHRAALALLRKSDIDLDESELARLEREVDSVEEAG